MIGLAVTFRVTLTVWLSGRNVEPLMTTAPLYVPVAWPVCEVAVIVYGTPNPDPVGCPKASQTPPDWVLAAPTTALWG